MYDPEDPRCARLTLTGKMVEVGPEEVEFAQEAMFSRCVHVNHSSSLNMFCVCLAVQLSLASKEVGDYTYPACLVCV